jgi:hypothetical protein
MVSHFRRQADSTGPDPLDHHTHDPNEAKPIAKSEDVRRLSVGQTRPTSRNLAKVTSEVLTLTSSDPYSNVQRLDTHPLSRLDPATRRLHQKYARALQVLNLVKNRHG